MKSLNLMAISLAICLFATQTYAQATKIEYVSKIIEQPDAPIKILTYKTSYGMHSKIAMVGEKTEGVRHQTEYQNISQRGILAVQIEYEMFNVFDEYLGSSWAVKTDYLKPNDKDKSDGVADQGFTFLTGVAFVSKVRFDNGEVWHANLDAIAQELAKIDKAFQASTLKPKSGSDGLQK